MWNRIAALALLLFAVPATSHACQDDPDAICAADSPWTTATAMRLRIAVQGSKDVTQLNLTMPGDTDESIEIASGHDGEHMQGKILLVRGRVMLTKDLPDEGVNEIDLLDGPVLMQNLAVSLLDQAFPAGPDSLKDFLNVSIKEQKKAIRIATQSASGLFAAPWSIKGRLEKRTAGTVNFSLNFDYTMNGKIQPGYIFTGTWSRNAASPAFDKNMKLDGWSLHSLGVHQAKMNGNTTVDYNAAPTSGKFGTLGALEISLDKQ